MFNNLNLLYKKSKHLSYLFKIIFRLWYSLVVEKVKNKSERDLKEYYLGNKTKKSKYLLNYKFLEFLK
jgi:hypothetical protein